VILTGCSPRDQVCAAPRAGGGDPGLRNWVGAETALLPAHAGVIRCRNWWARTFLACSPRTRG